MAWTVVVVNVSLFYLILKYVSHEHWTMLSSPLTLRSQLIFDQYHLFCICIQEFHVHNLKVFALLSYQSLSPWQIESAFHHFLWDFNARLIYLLVCLRAWRGRQINNSTSSLFLFFFSFHSSKNQGSLKIRNDVATSASANKILVYK